MTGNFAFQYRHTILNGLTSKSFIHLYPIFHFFPINVEVVGSLVDVFPVFKIPVGNLRFNTLQNDLLLVGIISSMRACKPTHSIK